MAACLLVLVGNDCFGSGVDIHDLTHPVRSNYNVYTSGVLFSTIAVDKFVDKLMKGRVSRPPVTAFSCLAIF
jgi:hypothetical protein